MCMCIYIYIYIYIYFFVYRFAEFQLEGLESQNHRLSSRQDARWDLRSFESSSLNLKFARGRGGSPAGLRRRTGVGPASESRAAFQPLEGEKGGSRRCCFCFSRPRAPTPRARAVSVNILCCVSANHEFMNTQAQGAMIYTIYHYSVHIGLCMGICITHSTLYCYCSILHINPHNGSAHSITDTHTQSAHLKLTCANPP